MAEEKALGELSGLEKKYLKTFLDLAKEDPAVGNMVEFATNKVFNQSHYKNERFAVVSRPLQSDDRSLLVDAEKEKNGRKYMGQEFVSINPPAVNAVSVYSQMDEQFGLDANEESAVSFNRKPDFVVIGAKSVLEETGEAVDAAIQQAAANAHERIDPVDLQRYVAVNVDALPEIIKEMGDVVPTLDKYEEIADSAKGKADEKLLEEINKLSALMTDEQRQSFTSTDLTDPDNGPAYTHDTDQKIELLREMEAGLKAELVEKLKALDNGGEKLDKYGIRSADTLFGVQLSDAKQYELLPRLAEVRQDVGEMKEAANESKASFSEELIAGADYKPLEDTEPKFIKGNPVARNVQIDMSGAADLVRRQTTDNPSLPLGQFGPIKTATLAGSAVLPERKERGVDLTISEQASTSQDRSAFARRGAINTEVDMKDIEVDMLLALRESLVAASKGDMGKINETYRAAHKYFSGLDDDKSLSDDEKARFKDTWEKHVPKMDASDERSSFDQAKTAWRAHEKQTSDGLATLMQAVKNGDDHAKAEWNAKEQETSQGLARLMDDLESGKNGATMDDIKAFMSDKRNRVFLDSDGDGQLDKDNTLMVTAALKQGIGGQQKVPLSIDEAREKYGYLAAQVKAAFIDVSGGADVASTDGSAPATPAVQPQVEKAAGKKGEAGAAL